VNAETTICVRTNTAAYRADRKVEFVRHEYIRFTAGVGVDALKRGLYELAHHADIGIELLVGSLWRSRGGDAVARSLTSLALFELGLLLNEATKRGLGDVVQFHLLGDVGKMLNGDKDENIAAQLADWLAESITMIESRNCISMSNVEHVAMAGIQLHKEYPKKGLRVAEALANCGLETKRKLSSSSDREARFALIELRSRLEQFTYVNTDRDTRERVWALMKRFDES